MSTENCLLCISLNTSHFIVCCPLIIAFHTAHRNNYLHNPNFTFHTALYTTTSCPSLQRLLIYRGKKVWHAPFPALGLHCTFIQTAPHLHLDLNTASKIYLKNIQRYFLFFDNGNFYLELCTFNRKNTRLNTSHHTGPCRGGMMTSTQTHDSLYKALTARPRCCQAGVVR